MEILVNKKTVVFDFDGVINSYTSGWKGIDIIPDPPVEGIKSAIDLIRKNGFNVVIVSTRCAYQNGIDAIRKYLDTYNIEVDGIQMEKPPCIVTIDDRAICFDGCANSLLSKVLNFKPWWEKRKFHLCTVLDKQCLYTDDVITDMQHPLLHQYIISMDKYNIPRIFGTTICPGWNFYGTILSKLNLLENKNYIVKNGDYYLPIDANDFKIDTKIIDDLEQYIANY